MPNVPERPVSEHPRDVRRWLLECVAGLWTESGTGWKVDVKKNLITRRDGDFTFDIHARPSPIYCRTGHVLCFPEWGIQSQRWCAWKAERAAQPPSPRVFFSPVRELRGPGLSPSQWLLVSPLGIDALHEPSKVLDGRAPLADLRRDVSPIFNAIFDADAFVELVHGTNLRQGIEMLEYFVAVGRPDLAEALAMRDPRAYSSHQLIDLGLSAPGRS